MFSLFLKYCNLLNLISKELIFTEQVSFPMGNAGFDLTVCDL